MQRVAHLAGWLYFVWMFELLVVRLLPTRDNADQSLEVVDGCLRAMRLGYATS